MRGGGAENDRPLKLHGVKLWDTKMTDQNAGHEIARHDKYLFIVVSTNPSNFSSIVENLM